MPRVTCRYCGQPVEMENRASSRVHPECRMAANRCKHCGQPVEPPRRLHAECKLEASKTARELAADAARRCSKCRKVKAPSMFSDDASRFDGKYPYCMECQMQHGMDHRLQDAEAEPNGHICPNCDTPIRGHANRRFCSAKCKEKVRSLKRNFNLDIADYRRLVVATGGRCPICQNRCKNWQVDHDHSTGRVTGVVCARCNVGLLAYSSHSTERASALLNYLMKTPAEELGIEAVAPADAPIKPSQLHKQWRFAQT